MRRDDRDDFFEEFFSEIERMMNDLMATGPVEFDVPRATGAGFGADTHVDVQEDDGAVRVIADLPGVDRDDIELTCDGEILTISADSEHRTYDERIRLPARVDEHAASASHNNGVLEVTLERADGSTDIDVV